MNRVSELPKRIFGARQSLFGLKLAFLIGVMGFFLYSIASTYAFVVFLQEDSVEDFLDGTFYFTGLSAKDDMVTLLPIGVTGDWVTDGSSLPASLTDLAAVALGDRIFAIGGYSDEGGGHYRTEIYSATVKDITGTLSAWVEIGNLPVGLAAHQAVLHPTTAETSTIFVLGGVSENSAPNSVDTIYRAVINNATGGLVSPAADSGQLLDQTVHYHSSVIWGDYVYIIGGNRLAPSHEGGDATYDTAYVASVSQYGELGAFSLMAATLPYPVRSATGVLYTSPNSRTIFVMGGTQADAGSAVFTPTVGVLIGDIDPDTGVVDSWWRSVAGDLVVPVWGHAGVIANGGNLFTLGGRAGNLANPVISNTVKSALVDENDDARIYNWCGHEPCERWQGQQGEQLLASRSGAAAVAVGPHIFVMGGVNPPNEETQSTVLRGGVGGFGGELRHYYAPSGYYRSSSIDLDSPYTQNRNQIKGLSWRAELTGTASMSLSMAYRYWDYGVVPPVTWTTAVPSDVYDEGGGGYVYTATINSPDTGTRYFQYEAVMQTYSNVLTPRLDWVRIYFDVPSPDVQVRKSGPAGVYPKDTFSYTIYYTAAGGVPAPSVRMTDVVPNSTTYVDSPGWTPAGGGVYTYYLGTKGTYGSSVQKGTVGYGVTVDEYVPKDALFITNVVSINYPPMIDSWGNVVIDPIPSNNVFTYVIPVYDVSWEIVKEADPPDTVFVTGERPFITYTIHYTFTGDLTETGPVWISDVVNLNYLEIITYSHPEKVDLTDGTLVWTDDASKIGPQQSRSVSFTVQVTRPLNNGTQFSNRASAASSHSLVKQSPPVEHTVVSTPTLNIFKDAVPPPDSYVTAGSEIQYILTVTNSGGMNATGAIITDTFDLEYLKFLTSSLGGIFDGSSTITWTSSQVPVDVPWVVTFTAQVTDVVDVTITNRAEVDCAQQAAVDSNVVKHIVPDVPILHIEKDDGRVQVEPGEVLTYEISFSNSGGVAATGIRITDTFPSEVLSPLDTNTGWTSCGDGCYVYTHTGELTAALQTVEFYAQVRSNSPLGQFVNQVSIGAAEEDAVPDSDTDTTTVILQPDLILTKSDGHSTIDPGEYLTYTIEFDNHDPVPYSLVLTEELPSQVRYVGYGWQLVEGNVYTRSLKVPANDTQTLLLFAQVNPGVTGSIYNTVTMDAGSYVYFPGGNQATDTTTVNNRRDLVIYKSNGVGGVNPGQRITYTIAYTNVGNLSMDGVQITDTLPSQVDWVESASTCGWTNIGGTQYQATLGPLSGGAAGQCRLVATVGSGATNGYMNNVVRIGGTQSEDSWANNVFTDTDFVYGGDLADLYVVTLHSVPVTPTVGAGTNFSVTVKNLGPGPAAHILPDAASSSEDVVLATFRLPLPLGADLNAAEDNCPSYNEVVYVGLYIDPYRAPERPDSGWWNYVGYFYLPLNKGQSATIENWVLDSGLGAISYGFTAPGWHRVYAQVDLWDEATDACGWSRTFGHIPETNELNNISSLDLWVEIREDGDGGVYLPVIQKNAP